MDSLHADELVGLVPHQLGFEPESSLVLVLMRSTGPHAAELGLMIRVDFPASARRIGPAAAAQIARLSAAEPRVDAAVLVFFYPVGETTRRGDDFARATTLICEALVRDHGIGVRGSVWATARQWGHVGEDECHDRAESAVTTRLMVEGSAPTASVGELCRLPAVGPPPVGEDEERARGGQGWGSMRTQGSVLAAEAALQADMAVLAELGASHARVSDSALDALLAERGLPDPRTAAVLDSAARHLPMRDAILAALGDPEQWRRGAPHTAAVVGLHPRRPDPWGIALGVAYGRRWAALSARSGYPSVPAFAILAWLEWSRMRISWAVEYLSAALEHDPQYGLARLLEHAVESGLRPAWMPRVDDSRRGAGEEVD